MKGIKDESLDFGAMKMGPGRAFSLNGSKRDVARVGKQWQKLEGRDFLTEEVEFKKVEPGLRELAPAPQVSNRNAAKTLHRVVSGRILPAPRIARKSTKAFQLAKNDVSDRPGYVLDYVAVNSASSFTFRGDTTYYVTNAVNIDSAILEGGTVIKFARTNAAQINLGTLDCQTAPYRPAILTAVDDNSVGDTITNISTGIPTNYYGGCGLAVSYLAPAEFRHIRMSYLEKAFNIGYEGLGWDDANLFSDIQVINCRSAIDGQACYNRYVRLENCLFNEIQNAFYLPETWFIAGSQLTVHRCGTFITGGNPAEIALTNTLFVAVTNWDEGQATYVTNAVACLTNDSGVFQTVGAGAHYLADNTYRNAGTTNLPSQLVERLAKMTTCAPLLFSNAVVTVSTNLEPYATRDTDQPDLGYHYDPVDFLCSVYTVTNATLTITNGAVIAYDNSGAGLYLPKGWAVSVGTPLSPNWMVHYATVQEQPVALRNPTVASARAIYAYPSGHGVSCRFTSFSVPAGGVAHLYQYNAACLTNLFARDCQFFGGVNTFRGGAFTTSTLQNNLFWRSKIDAYSMYNYTYCAFSNNLFYGSPSLLATKSGTTARTLVYNNVLDDCAIASSPACTNGFNAYIHCGTNHLGPNFGTDYINTNANAIAWQAGPLGDYYQPANSPLLNAGSADAFTAGLFHYTIQTNQVEETNSVVDIGLHYVATDANGNPLDLERCCIAGPQDQWACAGDSVIFSVNALGAGTFTYAWSHNGSLLAGETGSSLTITNVTSTDSGTYSVVVSGPCNAVTNSAQLFVNAPPVVTDQTYGPQCFTGPSTNFNQTNITLSVTATGINLTYQWYREGVAQSDNAHLTNSHASAVTLISGYDKWAANNLLGSWWCVVTSPCGLTGTSAVVEVGMLPEILMQPMTNRTLFPGDSLNLSIPRALGWWMNRSFQLQYSTRWRCNLYQLGSLLV